MGDWTVDGNLSVGAINGTTTNDILADAILQGSGTIKHYQGSGASYTGTVPTANYKYGKFIVIKRYNSGITVLAYPESYEAGNAINFWSSNNNSWSGWQLFYSVDTAYITDTHSSDSVSIVANNHTTVNITIGKTGYIPVGIIGITWTGSSWPSLAGFQMTSSTNVALYVVNPTSSAMSVTKYTVTILYRKV